MPLPSNPRTLQNYDITDPRQAKSFVLAVANLLSVGLTANGLALILNGSNTLNETALKSVSINFGPVGTNQTVSCAGATGVSVILTMTAALTLTLNNLSNSVPVYIRVMNTSGGALLLKITGTNAAGTPFASVLAVFLSGTAETNMATTGFSVASPSVQHFQGMANGGTNLFLMSL